MTKPRGTGISFLLALVAACPAVAESSTVTAGSGGRVTEKTVPPGERGAPESPLSIANALESKGRLEEALSVLKRAVSRTGPSFDLMLKTGWLYYRLKDNESAARAYRKALEFQPESEKAKLGLTLPLIGDGRWHEVEKVCNEVIEEDPLSYWAWVRLGLALYEQGSLAAALSAYNKALELRPGDLNALLGLGWTSVMLGGNESLDAAEHYFLAARAVAPKDARVTKGLQAVAKARSTPMFSGLAGIYGTYRRFLGLDNDRAFLWATTVVCQGAVSKIAELYLSYNMVEITWHNDYSAMQHEIEAAFSLHLWRGGEVFAGYVHVFGDLDTTNHLQVALLETKHEIGPVSLGLGGALSFYPDGRVLQVEPSMTWSPSESLSIRGTLTVLHNSDPPARSVWSWELLPSPAPLPGYPLDDAAIWPREARTLFSGSLNATWLPLSDLKLSLSAWGGERYYYVADRGHTLYSTDDLLLFGGKIQLGYDVISHLSFLVELRADYGQVGEATAEFTRDSCSIDSRQCNWRLNGKETFTLIGGMFGLAGWF
ncbi:MAG: tetratricopeptide repeat protein [Deltaproteobacteria bacterium]|nr:tetratricopeptide repeat protein [Deltaproteobacteria bacterium]